MTFLLLLHTTPGVSSIGELPRTNSLLQASSQGTCAGAADGNPGAPVIPNNLLFTHKTNLLEDTPLSHEDELLRANVLHTIALHPEATVIFDDDASCAHLLASSGAGEELMHWFTHSESMPKRALPLSAHVPYYAGKYRSDLCRLAQLYMHGGMYVDTDLQLVRSLAPLRANRLTTALGESGDHIFQALVVSEPQSPSIRRSLKYWNEWARGERGVQALIGGDLLLQAIADEERASPATSSGRATLRAAGVEILLEARGAPFAREQARCLASAGVYRTFENNCALTVQAEATNATFAYSRMVRAEAAADGARSCASAEPPVVWSCSCDHPSRIGAAGMSGGGDGGGSDEVGGEENGFTCVADNGNHTRLHTLCAPDAVCGHHGSWEVDLELVRPCVEVPALRYRRLVTGGNATAPPPPPPRSCPDACTGNPSETCFYDPACSDPDSPDYAGGLGCNAGGQGQDCRFCGFTAEGNDLPFIDCPVTSCPDVCTGNPIETCFYDPTCSDLGAGWGGGLGCNAGGQGQPCRFCGFGPFKHCPGTCPDACTGNPSETCFYDPACSDPDSPDYAGGLGCNAGGQGQDCRFCGFTAEENDLPFIDCPPPPPPASCDTTAMAGGYTCGARIEWLITAQEYTEAAAGAKVEEEFPTECAGCGPATTLPATNNIALAMGSATVVLVAAAGLLLRKRRRAAGGASVRVALRRKRTLAQALQEGGPRVRPGRAVPLLRRTRVAPQESQPKIKRGRLEVRSGRRTRLALVQKPPILLDI